MLFREKIYPYLLVVIQFSCLIYILKSGPLLAEGYGGIMLEALGIFLGLMAIYTMGLGNFNISPRPKQNGRLITHGVYKYIRHPMYAAQLWALLPLVIEHFNWYRLITYVILIIALLLKMSFEENHLKNQFEAYADYMSKSKRLIPFLY